MEDQTKLDPRNPKDAVAILNIATQTLSGPNAGSRGYAVSVQVALETLSRLANEPPPTTQESEK